MKTINLFIALVLVAGLALVVGPVPVANAVIITVDTTADDNTTNGNCTLREAIIAANIDTSVDNCPAGSGADTIDLLAGTYTLTISGTNEDAAATGDLDINDDLTITGVDQATTVIDGGGIDRVFEVHSGSTVDVSGVTVRNGSVSGVFPTNDGGGIANDGTLTLTDSTVSDNTAEGRGGGICNAFGGTVTLTDSSVSGNNADDEGGGIYNGDSTVALTNSTVSGNSAGINGGGIFNDDGAVTLTNSDVSDNQARGAETHEGGGGIFNDRGTVELIDSTVSGNSAGIDGSGIFNDDGALTLTDSTVSGNSGAKDGGGIYNNTGTVELINSTISGNSVGTDGGGICNAFGGTVTLTNSTISDNEAWYGGGIYNGGLGVVELANTIVAANPRGGDCCSGGTCSGPGIISLGHNLDSDGTCNLNPALGDLPNRDPRLGPLADNGGRTWTHALLPGSPAIDAGDDSACPATDQRGVIRPLDGDADGTATCDIGAYEFEPPTIVVPIDIKPGSDPNSINCNNKNGVIPVAILTTEDFEARTVDHTTLTFEGASEMHVDKKSGEPRRHEEDVDGDGDIDLVFHFRLGDTGLTCDSTEGTLTGETFDSRVIVGSDAVRMIDRGGGKP